MNTTKVLYVFVLSTLLVLTGCFGSGVIDDGEGQTTGDTGTNDNTGTTTTSSSNSAPYIDARTTGLMSDGMEIGFAAPLWETPLDDLDDDEEPVLTGFSMPLYHAVMDLDGTVATMGWDLDLDGTIDVTATGKRGLTNVDITLSEFVSFSQAYIDMMMVFDEDIEEEDQDDIDDFLQGAGMFMVTSTVAFIATDDGGATSAMMVNIDESIAGLFYVWASSLAESSSQTQAGTLNQYKAEDHPTATSADSDDNLMRLSFTNGPDDLTWSFLTITLFDEEDGTTYKCTPGGADCTVTEETADSYWGGSEVIALKEGGSTDICGLAGNAGDEGASCTLKVSMQYKGKPIAGTSGNVAVS